MGPRIGQLVSVLNKSAEFGTLGKRDRGFGATTVGANDLCRSTTGATGNERQPATAALDDDASELLSTHEVRERSLAPDRKSTRLNSSHSQISYAVFCLKKKNKLFVLTLHHPQLPALRGSHNTLLQIGRMIVSMTLHDQVPRGLRHHRLLVVG